MIMSFSDFHSYSLSVKEAAERREELQALNDAHLCWQVCTSDSEDICYTEDEVNQMRVELEADRIIYSIEELPF